MANTEQRLAGRRILVTRPTERADTLIRALQAQGALVTHLPLLAIHPLPADSPEAQACKARILELDRYQHAVAISVNAVHYGAEWIARYWPQWPVGITWYAVGEATAAALKEHAVQGLAGAGSMDSEALLARPELQAMRGQRVLILRGVGGREHLAAVLRSRGAQVDYAECYRRGLPAIDTRQLRQALGHSDAVCLNSGETLANLCSAEAEAPALVQGLVLVPSTRVADDARRRGFQRVAVAANAGTAATIEALITHLDAGN